MKDLIVILILVIIVALAALYIIKRKKAGDKCIGCPYAKECKKNSCGK
ncbi:MAG: FeoB-associated Cys-rich membrane protein [Ruminococcaceae bacterium]|nr:FeoB-associated Cys-rich membrane protein [Oscillospiraceae bacterium]